jgi:hypothetical protein
MSFVPKAMAMRSRQPSITGDKSALMTTPCAGAEVTDLNRYAAATDSRLPVAAAPDLDIKHVARTIDFVDYIDVFEGVRGQICPHSVLNCRGATWAHPRLPDAHTGLLLTPRGAEPLLPRLPLNFAATACTGCNSLPSMLDMRRSSSALILFEMLVGFLPNENRNRPVSAGPFLSVHLRNVLRKLEVDNPVRKRGANYREKG